MGGSDEQREGAGKRGTREKGWGAPGKLGALEEEGNIGFFWGGFVCVFLGWSIVIVAVTMVWRERPGQGGACSCRPLACGPQNGS